MPGETTDTLPGGVVDVVVIGGGAAGLNGALVLARSRRSVVVIDSGSPRNAPAEGVHGLLGMDGTPPAELLRRGREEVRRYGGRVVTGEVISASPADHGEGDTRVIVQLADGSTVHARRTLVATGLRDVLPDIPGLDDGHLVPRRILAVATTMLARTDGLEDLRLPMEDMPAGTGRRIVSGMAGTTAVPGVWVAGNATDLTAQVGASAAAGAHMNADLAAADADAALAAVQRATTPT